MIFFSFRKLRAGFTAHVPLLQRGEEGGALHGHDAAGGGLHGHRPLRRDEAREPDLRLCAVAGRAGTVRNCLGALLRLHPPSTW